MLSGNLIIILHVLFNVIQVRWQYSLISWYEFIYVHVCMTLPETVHITSGQSQPQPILEADKRTVCCVRVVYALSDLGSKPSGGHLF